MSTKKWFISIPYHAAVFIKVEAETEEEAIRIAENTADSGLCHQCAKHVEMGDQNDKYPAEAVEITK